MAICRKAARSIACAVAASFIILGVSNLRAQRFVEPGFRSYPLRAAAPGDVEESLRSFLADRISAGEPIDIVSDARSGRLLVRGSQEVQQLVDQFIQATDRPAASEPVAQADRVVRPYSTSSVEELNQRAARLRQQFANRSDVRIAADERTRQIVVHAPLEVHRQISASWNLPANQQPQPQVIENRQPAQDQVPAGNSKPKTQQVRLENITWQDLVKGLRSVQGRNAAISAPREGLLEVNLTSKSGNPARMQIDQQNHVIQISGSEETTEQWTRVVQAMDRQLADPGEQQAMGRLNDAQAETITRTITMLGGAGAAPQGAQWGGDVVQRMFGPGQREPIRVAQLPGNAAAGAQGGEEAAMLVTGDSAGSFLGPVRIEFLEGTDIFIVRGQKRDVDRVMQIIQDIEKLTIDTKPAIEVLQLNHANSVAVAQLVNELNAGPLAARQGDVSVSPLLKPNALLLIGRPAGVESVKEIVKQLDVVVEPSTQFRVFLLKYLPAVDAEKTINNLYNVPQQTTTATGEEPSGLKIRVRAVADFRSNGIVVQGSPRDLDEIGELLKQIDIEGSATVSEVRVFQLKNALAEDIADVLNDTLGTDESDQAGQQGGFQQGGNVGAAGTTNTQPFSSRRALMLKLRVLDDEQKKILDREILESGILSNVVVSPNIRANSVVVTAPQGSMDLIAEIVRQLDELAPQEAEIRVFTIVNGDAASLIEMLDTLFAQEDNQDGPLVQSAAGTGESTLVPLRFALDGRTNTIIASGNAADLLVVESILLKLDASDVSSRRTTVYELQIQQATSVATAITAFVQERRAAFQIAPDTITNYDLLEQEVIVVAEPDSNKLIISATEQYFEDIMDVVKKLDKRPDMVMVQCLIAEVDLDSTESLGVELGIQDSLLFNRSVLDTDGVPVPGYDFNNQPLGGGVGPGSYPGSTAGQAIADFALGRTNSQLGYGGLVLSASSESVSVLVRALQEARRLDVLSRPQVMMLNNTTGEVQVGSEVPYVTASTLVGINIQNSISFVQVGLILSVTPRISPDGLVVLDVLANKSELGPIDEGIPVAVTENQVIRAPQIETTRARTFVSARDGQTVILGGLITKSRAASERKVPYLGDVPFFGRLFRSDFIAELRTELLIILTPHIIRDEADIDRINSEEYARMSWCLGNVIETHGDIGPVGGMLDGGVVYSELGPANNQGVPTDATENIPADAMQDPPADITPAPTETWKSLQPQDASPPTPDDPFSGAKRSGVLLNSPRNASLSPNSASNGRVIERLPATDASPNYVRPVDYEDHPQVRSKADRSIYRFDDVPFNK